jgi:hypothetical protein
MWFPFFLGLFNGALSKGNELVNDESEECGRKQSRSALGYYTIICTGGTEEDTGSRAPEREARSAVRGYHIVKLLLCVNK